MTIIAFDLKPLPATRPHLYKHPIGISIIPSLSVQFVKSTPLALPTEWQERYISTTPKSWIKNGIIVELQLLNTHVPIVDILIHSHSVLTSGLALRVTSSNPINKSHDFTFPPPSQPFCGIQIRLNLVGIFSSLLSPNEYFIRSQALAYQESQRRQLSQLSQDKRVDAQQETTPRERTRDKTLLLLREIERGRAAERELKLLNIDTNQQPSTED